MPPCYTSTLSQQSVMLELCATIEAKPLALLDISRQGYIRIHVICLDVHFARPKQQPLATLLQTCVEH